MYGKYDLPCCLNQAGLQLSIQQHGEHYEYIRTCAESSFEKLLLISKHEVIMHPVEPVNTPKALTPYLLVEFDRALLIEPKMTRRIFLNFPIEIGIFVRLRGKEFQLIDVFSLTAQKFTLYGEPSHGIICKYWKSPIFDALPSPSMLHEGVLELTITNADNDWKEVSKVVLNAYGMKMFYTDQRVAMRARMKLTDGGTADTDVQDVPLENGMKRALKTYAIRKLSMMTTTFTMEYGI